MRLTVNERICLIRQAIKHWQHGYYLEPPCHVDGYIIQGDDLRKLADEWLDTELGAMIESDRETAWTQPTYTR